ncbi:CinA family protein, partial [Paracoccus sp. (in: a-proteobacteria)]|uniref:CinA family protein n=1 Tax=Paracoccus sp. TaxID=267 RepID=UPI0026DEBAB2
MDNEPTESLKDLAARVLKAAEAKGVMLATAESCTGGLVSAALTDIPGSSGAL